MKKSLLARNVISDPKPKVIGQKINGDITEPKTEEQREKEKRAAAMRKRAFGALALTELNAAMGNSPVQRANSGGLVRGHGIARTRNQRAKI